MSDKYQTYWVCGSRIITDYSEAVTLVDSGALVSEISAESQRANAEAIERAKQKRDAGLPTITPEQFKPYWTIDGIRYDDFAEVKRLVNAGSNPAIEISPQTQAEEATKQARIEKAQKDLEEIQYKEVTRQRHTRSPEGQRAEALRTASEHPGGIVSGPRDFGFAELDAFGPDKTTLLR